MSINANCFSNLGIPKYNYFDARDWPMRERNISVSFNGLMHASETCIIFYPSRDTA